jgi:hypothetical protein
MLTGTAGGLQVTAVPAAHAGTRGAWAGRTPAVGAVCGDTGLVDPGAGAGPTMEVAIAVAPRAKMNRSSSQRRGSRCPGHLRAFPPPSRWSAWTSWPLICCSPSAAAARLSMSRPTPCHSPTITVVASAVEVVRDVIGEQGGTSMLTGTELDVAIRFAAQRTRWPSPRSR